MKIKTRVLRLIAKIRQNSSALKTDDTVVKIMKNMVFSAESEIFYTNQCYFIQKRDVLAKYCFGVDDSLSIYRDGNTITVSLNKKQSDEIHSFIHHKNDVKRKAFEKLIDEKVKTNLNSILQTID